MALHSTCHAALPQPFDAEPLDQFFESVPYRGSSPREQRGRRSSRAEQDVPTGLSPKPSIGAPPAQRLSDARPRMRLVSAVPA